jgi:hypothetical protein
MDPARPLEMIADETDAAMLLITPASRIKNPIEPTNADWDLIAPESFWVRSADPIELVIELIIPASGTIAAIVI